MLVFHDYVLIGTNFNKELHILNNNNISQSRISSSLNFAAYSEVYRKEANSYLFFFNQPNNACYSTPEHVNWVVAGGPSCGNNEPHISPKKEYFS